MNRQETLAGQLEWACRNIAFNLDFVPDDRLEWKPSETADSVLGIANHVARTIAGGLGQIHAGNWDDAYANYEAATTRDEIKARLQQLGDKYAAELRKLPDAAFEGVRETSFGAMPNSLIISIPVFDAIHHHGQVAYLQTVWGDTEDHFFGMS